MPARAAAGEFSRGRTLPRRSSRGHSKARTYALSTSTTWNDDYVTEELYAIRWYAERRPNRARAGRLGFTWQPTNNFRVPNAEFLAAQDAIVRRIAAAIVDGYGYGGTPRAMCEPPGTDENWCDRGREGSTFTDQWEIFRFWEDGDEEASAGVDAD